MSKDFAWQLFKNTGNVDAFMIMRDIENSAGKLVDTDKTIIECSNIQNNMNYIYKNENDCK